MGKHRKLPEGVDITVPNVARVYDCALGGKDNFAVDREIVAQINATIPYGTRPAVENRAFLCRAVRFLVDAGIRQFLDIGSGLPTQGNVHEIVHGVDPTARVVYVDYDPVAVAHSNALLDGVASAVAVQADARDPDGILHHPKVRGMLDFTQPMAVLFVALLHVITDEEDPHGIVARFRDAMAPGSYLVVSHFTTHEQPPELVAYVRKLFERSREPIVHRSREEILRFFDGLELVPPGLVTVTDWRPERAGGEREEPPTRWVLGGVGYKR